jgi:hypothetical protein
MEENLTLNAPGAWATASINSGRMWNRTDIWLQEGVTYRVDAPGTWMDSYVNTTADGYTSFDSQVPWYSRPLLYAAESWRRQPQENWFKLIGCVGETGCEAFGARHTFTARKSGVLACYANDFTTRFGDGYSNNSGSITITVTRVSS